ncbi:MAG: cellulase family glycosylhydrolase [Myxococcales bacterium]
MRLPTGSKDFCWSGRLPWAAVTNFPRLTGAAAAGLIFLAAVLRPAAASTELRVEGGRFKDRQGRVVVLRGLNVAGNSKVPPFRPITSAETFDPLPGWGMNVVRLLFTWEAYESEMGTVAPDYLDYIARTADAAWARGLYVVIDFHQDAFSRYSIGGCGEGFPAWAIPPDVTPHTPDNGADCANWGTRMILDLPMHASWTAFHRGDRGVRERYLAMVQAAAARLASNPGVVGYDLLNEPWGDEQTELPALHRDAAAAVRRADPTAIIFISPHALSSAGTQTKLPRPELSGFAYAPHFYDSTVMLLKAWTGSRPDGPFANMRATASSWGVPLFLGELGAPAGTRNGAGYIDALYQKLDETFASAAHWVYTPGWTPAAKDGWNGEDLSIVDDRGQLRSNFRVRPYAQRIAGMPLATSVTQLADPSTNVVTLTWEHQPSAGATEIFLPRPEYFGTDQVLVRSEGEGIACTVGPRHVSCTSPRAGSKTVTISAGASGAGAVTVAVDGSMVDGSVADGAVPTSGGATGSRSGCGCAMGAHGSGGAGMRATLALLLTVIALSLRSRSSRR